MKEIYALAFLGGLAATGAWLWALYCLAPKLGLIDHPKGRKKHEAPTPIVGGLAILLGGITGFALLSVYVGLSGVWAILSLHKGYLIGGALLVGIGLWDDLRPVAARYKLLIQLAACTIAVCVDRAFIGDILISADALVLTLGPFVIPFTILVMLTVTNAINMIDGVDGLAGGIMFVATAIMAKALIAAGWSTAILAIGLTGALTAFLIVNFPILPLRKAKVFLGDCGSLLLGFTLAYLAINLSALPFRVFNPSTALWLFFFPVADTIWLYFRRMWFARAPFAPGRDHIQHLLLERFSPRLVTWILVGVSGVLAASAYVAERMGVLSVILILAWIAAFILYGLVTHKAWRHAWDRSRAEEGSAS
jgi:UDP-GlcNAc:undecaprenyl-phosphate/decaprenyl-phosphate GlcNAc-1-phosphate transferase